MPYTDDTGHVCRFELAAPTMTEPLIALPGMYQGKATVTRPGFQGLEVVGESNAGYPIVATKPDVYDYEISIPYESKDMDLIEQILIQQQANPGIVQFLDLLQPIATARITGGRTAYGTPSTPHVLERGSFQGYCLLYNLTDQEGVASLLTSDREGVFMAKFGVKEI